MKPKARAKERRKIRWWLIVLAALLTVISFTTPWTLEVATMYGATWRMVLFIVAVFLVIAAFPGYEFVLRRLGKIPWGQEDSYDEDDDR